MRAILPSLLMLLLPAPALAMNWEGHDDWMADMEPAVIYEKSAPHATPRADEACPARGPEAKDNPYEQIPLPAHPCPEQGGQPGR